MKKTQIIIGLLSISISSVLAQYGSREYPHINSWLTSGKTTYLSPGFVMGGVFPSASGTSSDFIIEKTDEDGMFTSLTTEFSRYYSIQGGLNCQASLPYEHDCIGVDVIETNPGSNVAYAVAGAFKGGIFFATLDATGAILSTQYWPITTGAIIRGLPSIRESAMPGEYYICANDEWTESYVMKVDLNGNPIFAKHYQSTMGIVANDLIESPYNPNELIIVGQASPNAWLAKEGMFLSLDANNGTVMNFICYSDPNYSGDEYFTSIDIAASNGGGSKGYVIGGHHVSGNPVGSHTWILKLDPNGNVVWSTLTPGNPCLDVFERYNPLTTPPSYEVYGITQMWNIPLYGVGVLKLDDLGQPYALAGNRFLYSLSTPPGTADKTYPQFDRVGDGTNTPGDGIAIFTRRGGLGEHTLVKTYFNGVTANSCNTPGDFTAVKGPKISIYPQFPTDVHINECPNFQINSTLNSYTPNNICTWALSTVAGGINARMSIATGVESMNKLENSISLYPNPSNGLLVIDSKGSKGQTQVNVTNSIGQLIKSLELNTQDKTIINLEELRLSEGMYFIHIISNGETRTEKIIYTK